MISRSHKRTINLGLFSAAHCIYLLRYPFVVQYSCLQTTQTLTQIQHNPPSPATLHPSITFLSPTRSYLCIVPVPGCLSRFFLAISQCLSSIYLGSTTSSQLTSFAISSTQNIFTSTTNHASMCYSLSSSYFVCSLHDKKCYPPCYLS